MGLLKTHINSQAGEYDFAKDPNGGAIGTIDTGVHLPSCGLIFDFWANALVPPTSMGLATISFGILIFTSVGTFVNPVALMPATPIASFLLSVPVQGVNLILNPIKFAKFTDTVSGINVCMVIAVAPLTAGRMQFWEQHQENDL